MAIFNETMVGGVNAKDCTADASKILDGYTAAVGKEIVTGTMPDNGNVDSAIANGKLKAGYTSGGTIANLIAGNIKKDVSIGGVTGEYQGKYVDSWTATIEFVSKYDMYISHFGNENDDTPYRRGTHVIQVSKPLLRIASDKSIDSITVSGAYCSYHTNLSNGSYSCYILAYSPNVSITYITT